MLTGQQLTVLDIRNRAPGKFMTALVMTMARDQPMLQDAVWVEAQTPQSYQWLYQTALPEGAWVNATEGTLPEVDGVDTMLERPGSLEMRSRIDVRTMRQAAPGEGQAILYQADMNFMMAMGQQGSNTMYYGSKATEPRQFDGFAAILSDLTRPNVWDAGATSGSATSIYAIEWGGTEGAVMFYPQGGNFGINRKELGEQTINDWGAGGGGKEMEVDRTVYWMDWGLAIRNHARALRICNIAPSELGTGGKSWNDQGGANLSQRMFIDAAAFLRDPVRTRLYMNRQVKADIRKAGSEFARVQNDPMNPFGVPSDILEQMICRVDDTIVSAEARLS